MAVTVAASVPAVADGVVRFARNAGRADDLDAGQGAVAATRVTWWGSAG